MELALLFHELAVILKAGIALIQACELIESSHKNPGLRILLFSIRKNLLQGKTLYTSLLAFPHYFDKMTCELIRFGEYAGQLIPVLEELHQHKIKRYHFKKQLQQLLFYPILLLLVASCIGLAILLFVVPRFEEIFINFKVNLPLSTQFICSLSLFFRQHLWVIFIPLILALWLFFWIQHKKNYSNIPYLIFYSIPLCQIFMHKLILARFINNLVLLFIAGLPILEALPLAIRSAVPFNAEKLIMEARSSLTEGLSLHRSLTHFPFISSAFLNMLKIGEESGQLNLMLQTALELIENEIERQLKWLQALFEPLIMLMLGVLIGGLLLCLYLPLFKLGSAF